MKIERSDICRRLAQLRERHFGARGKARFARLLGIRPSSYHHYELDRTPSAALLVQAARITDTRLEWLLTGEGEISLHTSDSPNKETEQLAQRMHDIIARRPELERTVAGFFDLLEKVSKEFPTTSRPQAEVLANLSELIPVVGSTAAGPARFWRELGNCSEGLDIDTRLDQLIANRPSQVVRKAELSESLAARNAGDVALVQLSRPDEKGVIEFLLSPDVKRRFPQATCWRIDGDSMAPRYRDGDLVVTSSDQPAMVGQPCVARQKGQIGVNCKIYRREANDVILAPLNESVAAQRVPASKIQWAHRVLFSVRLANPS